jgi:D-aminopeptidase
MSTTAAFGILRKAGVRQAEAMDRDGCAPRHRKSSGYDRVRADRYRGTLAVSSRFDRAFEALPHRYPGPGGAVAVLRDGEVLDWRAWGFANAERRIPFTRKTLFRMCSITKQFTCGLILDAFPDPSVLDDDVRARVPLLERSPPTARHLCHNQSGLRDYWALAMLQGAHPEQSFGNEDAVRIIGGTRTLQFAPGTRFSYANTNFVVLADILERRTGLGFAELLHSRIFERVGMESALLAADTRAMPDGTEGYDGTQTSGYRVAKNRIIWTGDAGIGASLDDMIAWERHIDATRDDPDALYSRLSEPVAFDDGRPATYGFGLNRRSALGRRITGHGGALRGWSCHRLHSAADRISVVVAFNHMADARGAAMELLAAAIDEELPSRPPVGAAPAWLGAYIEPETQLAARVDLAPDGLRLRYGQNPEVLDYRESGAGRDEDVRLRADGERLWMDRPADNQTSLLAPCAPGMTSDLAGRYRSDELDAEITVIGEKDVSYGAFSGFLGNGRMEVLEPIGADVVALPCPRALDHSPPGDWTLIVRRNADGAVVGLDVGCWLARRLHYRRVG